VTKTTASKWEQGLRKPSGSALRLLEIAEKQPHILSPGLNLRLRDNGLQDHGTTGLPGPRTKDPKVRENSDSDSRRTLHFRH